jgi:hypothetical protein
VSAGPVERLLRVGVRAQEVDLVDVHLGHGPLAQAT